MNLLDVTPFENYSCAANREAIGRVWEISLNKRLNGKPPRHCGLVNCAIYCGFLGLFIGKNFNWAKVGEKFASEFISFILNRNKRLSNAGWTRDVQPEIKRKNF